RSLAFDEKMPGRTQRERTDDGLDTELWLVVGMPPHVVLPIAIAVDEYMIELDPSMALDPLPDRIETSGSGAGLQRLPRIAVWQLAGPRYQARLHPPSTEQANRFLLPGQLANERFE